MLFLFCEYPYILVCIFLISQFLTTASDNYCNAQFDTYPGYPDCKTRSSWLKDNWQQPLYEDAGVDGSWCSIQRFLSNNGQYCPNPDWVDTSDKRQVHADGSQSFLVYRALSADNVDHPNAYAYTLLNANAADIAGVMSYLHTEVVPEYQRNAGGWEVAACARKFGIDNVIVFNVTVKTPAWVYQKYGDILGPFAAMDAGKCTAGGDACDFEGKGLYLPGVQTQGTNPRHAYPNGKWYSFPECGFCEKPTGDKYCTYTYEVLGKIGIDEIVQLPVESTNCVMKTDINFYGSDLRDDGWVGSSLECCSRCRNEPQCNAWTWNGPGSDGDKHCWLKTSDGDQRTETGVTSGSHPRPTFHSFCESGGIEYKTSVPSSTNDCTHGTYSDTSGIDFWSNPCDGRMDIARMERFSIISMDTTVKQNGSPPDPAYCPAEKPTLSSLVSKGDNMQNRSKISGNGSFIITLVVLTVLLVVCYLFARVNPWSKSMFLGVGNQLQQRINSPDQARSCSPDLVVSSLAVLTIFWGVLYLCFESTVLLVFAVITLLLCASYLCMRTKIFFSIVEEIKRQRTKNQLNVPFITTGIVDV